MKGTYFADLVSQDRSANQSFVLLLLTRHVTVVGFGARHVVVVASALA
jgi:hypothetical protein